MCFVIIDKSNRENKSNVNGFIYFLKITVLILYFNDLTFMLIKHNIPLHMKNSSKRINNIP